MDVRQAITNRKTVFSFLEKQVKDEIIIDILEAAKSAPAAGGIHEYEFVVVTERPTKLELSRICLTPHIETAPFIIVVACDREKLTRAFDSESAQTFCVENASLAIENILLYATDLGLGSAWIATVQQDAVKKLLNIPGGYLVRGVIPIGYPSLDSVAKPKETGPNLKDITHIESFNNKA